MQYFATAAGFEDHATTVHHSWRVSGVKTVRPI